MVVPNRFQQYFIYPMSLVLLQVFFIPARYPHAYIRVQVDNHLSNCDPNVDVRCRDKVVAALNLGLVCPHVLQLHLDLSHDPTMTASKVICAALTIVTKRVRDQVEEGGRPFKGAHVSVLFPHSSSSGPGLLGWRIKSTKMMILSNKLNTTQFVTN